MKRTPDVAKIAKSARFNRPEEASAKSPVRILHAMNYFAHKPASSWPGGADAEAQGGVTVLEQTITVSPESDLPHTASVSKFTLLLLDSDIRIIADVPPNQGIIAALLTDVTVHVNMEPETAAQVFQHYMALHKRKPLTPHSGA